MESPILVAELGSGGMADVFLAMRRGMGGFVKLVVVKRLRTSAMEGDAVAMFHDEARISARLNHPNVVQTHEVGFDGEHYRLEMEYLDGQPLHRIVHRAKKAERAISHGVAVTVVRDVLAGLRYAHELCDYDGSTLGIVHRDVSPQNIFVTYDGRVKLVDFGIAKAAGQMAVTQLGMVKGKIRYMAPEQATGRPVDVRADVFATGIVLWQLLVGRGYWADNDDLTIFHRLKTGDMPPSPRALRPEIPEALDLICARALAHDPDDRYATAAELLDALEASGLADTRGGRTLGSLAEELFEDVREKIRTEIEKAAGRPVGPVDEPLARIATAQSSDSERRLQTSERPVSQAVRIPEPRRFRGVPFAALVLMMLGITAVVARMSASRLEPQAIPAAPARFAQEITPLDGHPVAKAAAPAVLSGAGRTASAGAATRTAIAPIPIPITLTVDAGSSATDASTSTVKVRPTKGPPLIDIDIDPWDGGARR